MVETVELNYRYYGGEGNPPVIILHGLLGSSRNWTAAAKGLTHAYDVFALDQRNHGDSPHAASHTYDDLVGDLKAWIDRQDGERVSLIGHSMGGKAAMVYACRYPERVRELFIADISPKVYQPHFAEYLEAMASMNTPALETREEAEEQLKPLVDDWRMRRFLLTNLERDPETKRFRWKVNIPVLLDEMETIAANPLQREDRWEGPALFIRGGNSPYIEDTDHALIREHFPEAQLVTLEDAGHNVHVDQREAFTRAVLTVREAGIGKCPTD